MRCLLIAAASVIVLSAGPVAYTVTGLPAPGGLPAAGFAIGDTGAAAGTAWTPDAETFAVFWQGGSFVNLGSGSRAAAVNASGTVAGTRWRGGAPEATVWTAGAPRVVVPGYGTGINSAGEVAGSALQGQSASAFVTQGGQVVDIGAAWEWSSAYDLNDLGQACGTAYIDGRFQAFFWSAGAQVLGDLGGGNSYAMALNERGQVVGSSTVRGGYLRAFLWASGAMKDLGTLGGASSGAYGVNGSGAIVGYSYDSEGRQRAFVWWNGTMYDLNALIEPGSGWTLEAAYGINERGQIVGSGTFGGRSSAFVLDPAMADAGPAGAAVPEPGPEWLLLGGLGALAGYRALRSRVPHSGPATRSRLW